MDCIMLDFRNESNNKNYPSRSVMSIRKLAEYPIFPLLFLSLIIAPAQIAFSHGGAKHGGVGLAISLPDVVAKVNDANIEKDAIEKGLNKLIHNSADKGKKLSADQQKSIAKKLIEEEIAKTLILLKAKELGMKVSPEQAMKARKPASILLTEAVLEKEIGSKIKVSEADIKEFYEKNQNLFIDKEKVRASIILIKIDREEGPGGEKKAREEIMKLADKIKNGAVFALVAKDASQDSLASKGGDLGFFSMDSRLPAVFKKYAFNLEVGSVSEVFSGRYGFHLMKVTAKKPGALSPLEEEKVRIGNILKLKEMKKRTPGYVQALRKKAKVQTYF